MRMRMTAVMITLGARSNARLADRSPEATLADFPTYGAPLVSPVDGRVVRLVDEESDAEWARRAPNVTPADLSRLAREQSKPTVEDGRARRAARHLRTWRDPDGGMLHGRFAADIVAMLEAT